MALCEGTEGLTEKQRPRLSTLLLAKSGRSLWEDGPESGVPVKPQAKLDEVGEMISKRGEDTRRRGAQPDAVIMMRIDGDGAPATLRLGVSGREDEGSDQVVTGTGPEGSDALSGDGIFLERDGGVGFVLEKAEELAT